MDVDENKSDEKPISEYLPENILLTRNARAEAERRLLEYDMLTRFASLWCVCLTTVLTLLSAFSKQDWLPFVSTASAMIMTIVVFYASSRSYADQAARMKLCYTELQELSFEASSLLSSAGADLDERMVELGKRYTEVLKRSDNHTKHDYIRAKKERNEKTANHTEPNNEESGYRTSPVSYHNQSFYIGIVLIIAAPIVLLALLAGVFLWFS